MENAFFLSGVILACLTFSFFFSGMEAGVLALNRLHIRQKMRSGDRRAGLLLGYLENREQFLWTIFIGSALTNFLLVCLVASVLHLRVGEYPAVFWGSFMVFVFLLYTFGELLPKMLFRSFPNRLCLGLALPFRFVYLGLTPLVSGLSWLTRGILRWTGGRGLADRLFSTREELRLVMQESAQSLSSEERSMINRVLDLQTLTVRQVMRPLEQAVAMTAQTPVSAALALCRERKLTRLPVWEQREGAQRIIGLLALNTLLYHPALDVDRPVSEYMKPALFLDEDLRLEVALRRLQRSGQRLAIVLSRERLEIGILSLQDVLKVVFGEVSW